MAYLGLFTIIFTSCIMCILASTELDTSEIEDEGRLFFGTATGTAGTAGTSTQITGLETTVLVGVAFFAIFLIWILLIAGQHIFAEEAATAYAPTAYETDPYAADEFAAHPHHTAFASGHHAPAVHHAPAAHHAPAPSGLHSSYSVLRSLEVAARKYL